jgi:hypothetical protein
MIKVDSISAVDKRWPKTLITSTRRSLQVGHPPVEVLTIDMALDPNVIMFILRGIVSGVKKSGVWLHIGPQVMVVVVVDRPRLLEYENTLDVVTLQFLSNTMRRDEESVVISIPYQRQGPK